MSPDDIRKLLDALSPGDEAELTFGNTHVKIRKGNSAPQALPTLPALPFIPQAPQPQPAPWVDRTGYPPWWQRETIICTTDATSQPLLMSPSVTDGLASGVRVN